MFERNSVSNNKTRKIRRLETSVMDVDAQGLTADEYADLLCSRCHNSPLAYYCPMCDFKACLDCLHKAFRRKVNGALVCRNCGHVDTRLDTFVGHGKA